MISEEYKEFCRLCWHPEYLNAWRLCFEGIDKRPLLHNILEALPKDMGQVEFSFQGTSSQFIIMFNHDYENTGAIQNEAKIIYTLGEINAIPFFGAEGVTEASIDLSRFHSYPHQDTIWDVARFLLEGQQIGPIGFAAITSSKMINIFGIEDPELYNRAATSLTSGNHQIYQAAIHERRPKLFENLLKKMEEKGQTIAGVTLTDFNFYGGHDWLSKEGISHIGIRSASVDHNSLSLVEEIRKQLSPTSMKTQLFYRIQQESLSARNHPKNFWTRLFRKKTIISPIQEPIPDSLKLYTSLLDGDPLIRAYGFYGITQNLLAIGKLKLIREENGRDGKFSLLETLQGERFRVPKPNITRREERQYKKEVIDELIQLKAFHVQGRSEENTSFPSEDATMYHQTNEFEAAKIEVPKAIEPTIFPSTILKEVRSWAITLLVLGMLSIFASGFLSAPWGILLLIVGLASFYFRSSAIMVVYGTTLAWAGISNLVSGQGFLIGFALLQGFFVFQIFQRFIAFRRAEESWSAQEVSSNGLTPQRLAGIFPWAASILGVFSLLGLVGILVSIIKNQAIPQPIIFLGDLIVNFGVLGFAIGLASFLNKHPRGAFTLVGMVTSIVTLLIAILLRFI